MKEEFPKPEEEQIEELPQEQVTEEAIEQKQEEIPTPEKILQLGEEIVKGEEEKAEEKLKRYEKAIKSGLNLITVGGAAAAAGGSCMLARHLGIEIPPEVEGYLIKAAAPIGLGGIGAYGVSAYLSSKAESKLKWLQGVKEKIGGLKGKPKEQK